VRYKKFRGRGPGAFESVAGADGIIQIEVIRATDSIYKGILFQAKKKAIRRDRELVEQVQKMERLARGCSAVFEYAPDAYRVVTGRSFLEELNEPRTRGRDTLRLGTFLADAFLPCSAGIRGMYYDAVRQILLIPEDGQLKVMHVELGHRIAVEVESQPI
jgi:hypothetical protein